MGENPYKDLAERLDALPQGFPATDNGVELELLAKLFTPDEAALAASLRLTLETPQEISQRTGEIPAGLGQRLKSMARRGLIAWGRGENGPGYGLMPFVVGIYEMQTGRMDQEFAQLFEEYYQKAFTQSLSLKPQVHRVIPVGESVQTGLEIRPFESASEIVGSASSWGVVECICRTQKALVGDPCEHPRDVCMVLSESSGTFDHNPGIQALTQAEAMATLTRAADAGLVHSVSNNQKGLWYICNCCTCSCGILRGMAEMGIANVVASSAFVNQVDEQLCQGCGDCLKKCQFNALSLDGTITVNEHRCVGCGVCVLVCPDDALGLILRPDGDFLQPPVTASDWLADRAHYRGLDLFEVL